MEQNKYFTPDTEDLYVGYQLEANFKGFETEDDYWKLITLVGIGQEIIKYNTQGVYRVPYLTKEQLEAEGWVVTMREVKPAPYKVDWINAKKEKYSLWINLALTKSMHLGIDDQYGIRYRGECKDINTFRKIIKLLNIK